MSYDGLIFILLASGLLALLAFRLGVSIYVDYNNASQVRGQLQQRLKLLQLQSLLRSQGMNATELLYSRPLYEAEQLIRQCESCELKQECARRLSRGNCDFGFCPLRPTMSPDTSDID